MEPERLAALAERLALERSRRPAWAARQFVESLAAAGGHTHEYGPEQEA